MNWLARLTISNRLAMQQHVYDSYAWHQKLWECLPDYPDKKRTEIGFLTRIDELEGRFQCWVLSEAKPSRPTWCPEACFALKEISASFLEHRFYRFDIVVNPVQTKVVRAESGETLYRYDAYGNLLLRPNGKPKRKHGKKVPIVGHDALCAWIEKKGNEGGFRVCTVQPLAVLSHQAKSFSKKGRDGAPGQVAYHAGVQFRGVLEVVDRAAFAKTYRSGIGSAKGFGFGLFLLAPFQP